MWRSAILIARCCRFGRNGDALGHYWSRSYRGEAYRSFGRGRSGRLSGRIPVAFGGKSRAGGTQLRRRGVRHSAGVHKAGTAGCRDRHGASQHGPIELALAEAGIPFLVEKPIGLDDAIPDRIADTLSRRNLVAAVGYNWRALDTLAAVRRQIEQTPIRMVIGRFHIGTPLTPWWRFEAHSGGQMLEQACHLIDLSRYLAGAGQLLAAAGTRGALPGVPDGDVAGTSAALFLFGGVPGVITAACVLPNGPGAELRLICEGCEIAIGLAGVTIVRGRESSHTASGTSSYALQDRAFFDAVRRNRPDVVLCPYDDALATHRLALAAARQIRQN